MVDLNTSSYLFYLFFYHSHEYSYSQSINSASRITPRSTPKATPYGTPKLYGGINPTSGNTPTTHYGSYQN
jgi:hypothetical protein